MAKSFREHFDMAGDDFFIKKKFDVLPFCGNRFSSNNTNMLSRLQNSMHNLIKEHVKLPKYIIILLDNDLIEFADFDDYGIMTILGEWVEYLVKEFKKTVQ